MKTITNLIVQITVYIGLFNGAMESSLLAQLDGHWYVIPAALFFAVGSFITAIKVGDFIEL